MEYKKHIQILRGISIILVLCYHLNISSIHSGFLGVDVFFVISGYLMAILYKKEHKLAFFAKRARRLLPAYFTAVLGTLIVCMVRTTPNEFDSVVKQAIFANFFASNFGYWLENSYFSKADFNPLLHLWSLGVEIQFYLALPLLSWVLERFKSSYFLLLFGSLAADFFVVGISPKTAFFMLPLRLWEFLIGYGVARYLAAKTLDQASPLRWIGVLCLAVLAILPVVSIDGDKLSFLVGHPGIPALIVCLATAVVLAVGLPPAVETLRLATVWEKFGDYSYSIYLVHFPVIVLFLYRPFSGTILQANDVVQTLTMVGTIGVLSLLNFHFVETPFRLNRNTPGRMPIMAAAVLILCAAGTIFNDLRIPEREMLIYRAWTDRAVYRCGKIFRLLHPLAISCELNETLDKPVRRVLLVGNSYADAIKTTFASVATSRNVVVRFIVENDPLIAGGMGVERLIDEAQSRRVDAIVLHYSPQTIDSAAVAMLAARAESHGIAVSFIMPVPVWREHVPLALWNNLKRNKPLPTADSADYSDFNKELIEGLPKIHAPNLRIYRTAEAFCRGPCAMTDGAGRPLYFDQGHLTLTGSELMRSVLETTLDDLVAAPEPRTLR
jgi:peptidoglycan/LPS O-acetylase OafA/YrhL